MFDTPLSEDELGAMDEQAERFLSMLWGAAPEGVANYVWEVGERKLSKWVVNAPNAVGSAMKFIRARRDTVDLYTGVCPAMHPKGGRERTKLDDVWGMTALWADLDVRGVGHKADDDKLFTDADEALDFASRVWLPPTMTVWSGGGVHAWWLLGDPWGFKDGELTDGRVLAQAWIRRGMDAGQREGRTVDPVVDLTRVLRIPGTFNYKDDAGRREVRLLSSDGPHYTRDEIYKLVTDELVSVVEDGRATPRTRLEAAREQVEMSSWQAEGLEFTFRPDCELPARWSQTVNAIPEILQTWEADPDRWESLSEHQMSLANELAEAGFDAQELMDALVVHRREHGDLDKGQSYWNRTISKALGRAAKLREDSDLFSSILSAPSPSGALTTDQQMDRAQEILTGVPPWAGIDPARDEVPAAAAADAAGGDDVLAPSGGQRSQESPTSSQGPEQAQPLTPTADSGASSQESTARPAEEAPLPEPPPEGPEHFADVIALPGRPPVPDTPMEASERRKHIAGLGRMLGVPFIGVELHDSDPKRLVLLFEGGRSANLGTSDMLLRQQHVTAAVLNAVGTMTIPMEASAWRSFVQSLWRVAVPVDMGEGTTKAGQIRQWIGAAVSEHGGKAPDHSEDGAGTWPCVTWRGQLAVSAERFLAWLETSPAVKPDNKVGTYDLAERLRSLDGALHRITLSDVNGVQYRENMWVLPQDWRAGGQAADGG